MRAINEISDAVRRGERITTDDAITLWREAPLWLLAELAVERKRRMSGEYVYYNRNVHIEPSNICLFNCEFCSFRRREGDADAWFMSIDEVEARAKELQTKDITEVHIVGGVHPSHTLDTYCEMIRRVKSLLPHVSVKAYTAVEIFYMIRKADVTIVEGLRRLIDAGMDSIPGGGAEIFDEELRKKICPDKCNADEWLALHRAAHHMGLHTNCTMLYGHIETIEQRVDHLNRLRDLQEDAPGFDAFIPLKYRSRNNRMSEIGECSVEDDLRTIAMSRIFLDNIPHIKAYWVAYGKAVTEMALAYGADDIDGTIDDSTKIYSMAGADQRPTMSVEELEALVRDAGFVPVERDTHYNIIDREGRLASMTGGVEALAGVAAAATATAAGVAAGVAEGADVVAETVESEVEVVAEVVESEVEAAVEVVATEVEESIADVDSRAVSVETTATEENIENMSKKKRFVAWLKRFWQGTKRAYKRYLIIFHLVFIILFLMFVVMMLYFGLKWGTRHGEVIALPNFVGMQLEDAESLAAKNDLEIVVTKEDYGDPEDRGRVKEQTPSISDVRTVTVKPGRRIYVTIYSNEQEIIDVPYVARQPLSPALQRLNAQGFKVGELVYERSDAFANQVLGQMVNGREMTDTTEVMMPRGTGVTLRVSYTDDDSTTEVPIVVGASLADAQFTLWEAGLNVGAVSLNGYDRRSARVVAQGIGPRKVVSYGEAVSLELSEDDVLIDSMSRAAVHAAEVNVKWRNTEVQMRRAGEMIREDVERRRVEYEEQQMGGRYSWGRLLHYGDEASNEEYTTGEQSTLEVDESYDEYDLFNL